MVLAIIFCFINRSIKSTVNLLSFLLYVEKKFNTEMSLLEFVRTCYAQNVLENKDYRHGQKFSLNRRSDCRLHFCFLFFFDMVGAVAV